MDMNLQVKLDRMVQVVRWLDGFPSGQVAITSLDLSDVLFVGDVAQAYKFCFSHNYVPVDADGTFDFVDLHCDSVEYAPTFCWARYWQAEPSGDSDVMVNTEWWALQ